MTIKSEKKDMNILDYLVYSEVTERKFPDGIELDTTQSEILHAAMGLVTESGEIMDALKKHLIYGKPLDWANLNEELGDLYWYLAILHRYLIREKGTMPGNTMQTNIDKLKARYPNGFTELDALSRDLDTERSILEDGIDGNS